MWKNISEPPAMDMLVLVTWVDGAGLEYMVANYYAEDKIFVDDVLGDIIEPDYWMVIPPLPVAS